MKRTKLGSVLTILHGFAFKSECYVEISPYRLVTLGNFEEGNNSFKMNDARATYYGAEFPKDYVLNEGDLIMPLTEQAVGLFGNSAFVPKAVDYSYVLNQRVGKVVCDESQVDKFYLHYLLATDSVKTQLENRASGTRQRNISLDDVYDVEVYLPSLVLQKQIGRFLFDLEKKQEVNAAICDDLESMAKLIYDYWFVQFDFPDDNGKPYKSSGGEMVWNKDLKREIPKGWTVKCLGDLVSYNRGVSYTGDDLYETGTPIISLASIDRSGRYIPNGIKYFKREYPSSKVLKPYDLIMANTDMTQERAVMGKMIYVPDIFESDVLATHHITRIKMSEDFKAYLMMTTQTDWFHDYIKGFSSGTNVLGMDMTGFEDYLLLCPSQKALMPFNRIVKTIYAKIFEVYKENETLIFLRDFLLPMLMNGQVTVSESNC